MQESTIRKVVTLPTSDPVAKLNVLLGDDLRKIGDVPTLAKAVGDIADALKQLAGRLKIVEDQPMPMGTTSVNLQVVDKAADRG
jgi:uncharacterized protein YoxC